MSTSATFFVRSDTPIEEITAHVQQIWRGQSADAIGEPNGMISVHLEYLYGEPGEKGQTIAVALYLFDIASDGKVYYVRDYDAYVPTLDSDFKRPIGLDEIFTKRFTPGMFNGRQLRYELKKQTAQPEAGPYGSPDAGSPSGQP